MRLICVTFLALTLPLYAQPKTIVGNWAQEKSHCKTDDGVVAIAPMSVNTSDFICKFTSVARSGAIVTWQGNCTAHNEGKYINPETVTATETNGKLQLSFAKNKKTIDMNPLIRCN